jgi:hypothetical protein
MNLLDIFESDFARDKWNKASDEREAAANRREAEMTARHRQGKEDMSGAIDRLEKHMNTPVNEKLKGLPKKLGSSRDLGKSVRKFRAARGLEEGAMKEWLWKEAERLERNDFIANAAEYGMSDEEAAEWWDSINGMDESGIGQDIVNRTEKMARATPPTRAGAVASTVKNAAKWLAGKGGPGKEGPTYEGAEDIEDRGEYDREGDMAKDNIHTIVRNARELESVIGDNDNLPEWVQDKLANIKGMMTAVSEYMQTQHEREGVVPEGTETQWSKESPWTNIPKNKAGKPVDPRGEVAHMSDVARREAALKARGLAKTDDAFRAHLAQKKNPKAVDEAKWDPWTGGDFGDNHDMNHLPSDDDNSDADKDPNKPSAEQFKAMIQYYGNDMLVKRALMDLYSITHGENISGVNNNVKFAATFERNGKTEVKYLRSKKDAYNHANATGARVVSIEPIETDLPKDLITLPVMLGLGDHKKKWMLQFPDERIAQKWEFNHKNAAQIQWPNREVAEHGGGIGPKQHWQDLMPEGFQDFNKVEPYAVCLAGKPVKKFDYYEEARRFHDNWKQKLYREGDMAKAEKITLMPLNLDENETPNVKLELLKLYNKAMKAPAGSPVQKRIIAQIDALRKQEVNEVETDYSKRRQRERDIDAGKPVTKTRQPKMTDYQKRRAQDKKDMELGEEKIRLDPKCWTGKKIGTPKTKMKGGVRVNNCVPATEDIYMEDEPSPVESAIIRRIMVSHVDWLQKFGPEKVMQAAEEVAYNVGDVDEIGTSDVSAYVHEVGRILGAV